MKNHDKKPATEMTTNAASALFTIALRDCQSLMMYPYARSAPPRPHLAHPALANEGGDVVMPEAGADVESHQAQRTCARTCRLR